MINNFIIDNDDNFQNLGSGIIILKLKFPIQYITIKFTI